MFCASVMINVYPLLNLGFTYHIRWNPSHIRYHIGDGLGRQQFFGMKQKKDKILLGRSTPILFFLGTLLFRHPYQLF